VSLQEIFGCPLTHCFYCTRNPIYAFGTQKVSNSGDPEVCSESDLRDYVKKRKISGSTRSQSGRRCRDTFASLKKTCRKNRLSFWQYLQDRVCGWHRIAPLAQWIFEATPTGAIVPIHGP